MTQNSRVAFCVQMPPRSVMVECAQGIYQDWHTAKLREIIGTFFTKIEARNDFCISTIGDLVLNHFDLRIALPVTLDVCNLSFESQCFMIFHF